LLNSTFQPRELERERGVIAEEINRTLDTPDDLARLRRYLLALSTAGCEIPCPQTWEYLSGLPWE